MYWIRKIAMWVVLLMPFWVDAQTPSDIEGLELWFRGDEVEVAEGLFSWNDLSGNENNASQAVLASNPTIGSGGETLNNRPVLIFDGADDHLLVDNPLTVGTVFVVANYTNPAGQFDNFDGLLTGQTGGNPSVLFIGANGTSQFYSNGFFGDNIRVNNLSTTSFMPLDQWKHIRGTGPVPSLFNSLVIGRDRGDNSRIWHGGIAEIIVYANVLSAQEIEAVNAYLLERYTPPIALNETYQPQDFCTVNLDAGPGFLNYLWSTDEPNQVIQTDTAGVFTVQVTTTFGELLSDTATVTYPGNFIESFILCTGSDSLWQTGLNPTDFTFEWSDGSTQPDYLFADADSARVTVFDDQGCSYTSPWVVAVVDSFPAIDALPPTVDLCQGGALTTGLDNTDGLSFSWSDGSTEPFVSVFSEGVVSVEITNLNGCTISDQTDVSIVGVSPEVNFSSTYTCSEAEVHLNDLSFSQDASEIVSWQWAFGDGESSEDQNPTHIFPASGVYEVSLSVATDSGCSAQITNSVEVPSVVSSTVYVSNNCVTYTTAIADSAAVAFDEIISMQWELYNSQGESLASGSSPAFEYDFTEAGVYQFVRTYQTALGCEQEITDAIEVLPPAACFSPGEMESLALWLAADSAVTATGAAVASWPDQSAGNNSAQIASPIAPQLIEAVPELNNHSSVRIEAVNTWMEFSEIEQTRTVVALFKHQTGTQDNFPTLLGHQTDFDFVGASDTLIFNTTSASPDLLQGLGRINGEGQNVADMVKPTQYSMLSLVPNSPLTVQFISKDRNFTNRGWLGDYVELLIFNQFLTEPELELIEQYLRYKYAPPVDLPTKITQTYGFCPVELSAEKAFFSEYLWSTGETSSSITVSESGMYAVTVTDIYGYTSSDSVEVTFPGVFLSGSEAICMGDSLIYDLELPADGYSFLWNTADTTTSITITESGNYSVEIADSTGCVFESEPLELSIDSFPVTMAIDLSPTFCEGNDLGVVPGDFQVVAQTWSTGETTPTIVPQSEGDYWVQAQNTNGCVGIDSVSVSFLGIAPTINYTTSALCEQLQVMFWDNSSVSDGTPITAVDWVIFGEELTGSQVDFIFDQYGATAITLRVQSAMGCVSERVDSVYVNPIPIVDFDFSLSCSGQNTLFEDLSTVPVGALAEWEWDFGTGNVGDQPSETVLFESPGAYNVSLVVTSEAGCGATKNQTVLVNPSPVAAFSWSPTCLGDLMHFESNSDTSLTGALNYAWNFAGLSTSGQTVDHLFSEAGEHVVKHEVWITVDGVPACFHEITDTVVVSTPPQVQFATQPACAGSSFSILDQSIAGQNDSIISWSWSANGQLFDSVPETSWMFFQQGVYPLSLHVETLAGCAGSATEWVEVGLSANPEISFSPQVGLPPLEVAFSNLNASDGAHFWDFGDGSEGVEAFSPTHTYSDTGVYYLSLAVIDEVGCIGTDTDSIFVIEPFFDVSIEDVSIARNGQLVSVSCVIGNYNNHPLTEARISARLGNGSAISKHWQGTLAKNQLTAVAFDNDLSYTEEINSPIVCVEIELVNNSHIDQNPANNQRCISFGESDFEVYAPYPNPTQGEVSQIVELSESALLNLQITQLNGKVLAAREAQYPSGLSVIKWNTNQLGAGVYVLRVAHNANVKWHKLMVIKK